VAAYARDTVNLTGVAEPAQLKALRVSHDLLGILGVAPALGRSFLPEEDRKGGAPAVILGHDLWVRRFGSDPRIVGEAVTLDGTSCTIVGVLPRGLSFPDGEAEVWIPRIMEPGFMTEGAVDRGAGYLDVVARLAAGVTREQAQAELDAIARSDRRASGLDANLDYRAVPLREQLTGAVRPTLLVLLGAVGFVLLIACANVANLLLARASGRRKEMAVRAVLGASRARLILHLLAESVLLALVSGAVGLLVAKWGLDALLSVGAAYLPRAAEIGLDGRVLAVTALLSLLTGVAFGLAPALHASKADLGEALKEAGMGSIGGRRGHRIRGALVVSEVALSMVLMIGSGLLIRSFLRLMDVDTGFNTRHLLVAEMSLPPSKYPKPPLIRQFYARLAQEISSLPGVVSVGAAETMPLAGPGAQTLVAIDGQPVPPPGERAVVSLDTVTPGYFRTMGIPLKEGRVFTDAEDSSAPITVVISESFARRFFPGVEAVGRHVILGRSSSAFEIVGIVGDVRAEGLDTASREMFYLSENQRTIAQMSVVVRTTVEPLGLASALRARVAAIDADQPVARLRTMEQVIGGSVAGRRFVLILVAVFAGLALALAAAGIYSVTSYIVSQRTAEIGLRVALGAGRGDVVGLIVGKSLSLTLAGLAAGAAASLGLSRVLASLLYGVGAADPLTFASIAVLLTGVSLVASALPALRATRIDPLIAIRYE
jgi:predicted permease